MKEPTTRAEYVASIAVLLVALLVLFGAAVPSGNEYTYLMPPYKLFHPEFLKGDWTYSGGWGQDFVFNLLSGSLMLLLPLEAVGWLGRLACWTLTLIGLMRLGRRFGLRPGMVSLAILLWLALGQSVVGGEWMFGDFEAKCVAYVFLLFAVDRFLDGRDTPGAVLLGLCFSFHPSVGFAGALATATGLWLVGRPWTGLLRIAGVTLLFALPGIVPGLPLALGSAAGTRADWRLLTLVRMPFHIDAASFPIRAIGLLYLLLLFNGLQYREYRGDRALRLLLGFEIALGAVFAGGLVVRYAGWYELLKILPFRLFPVFAPLFFMFQLMRTFQDRAAGRPRAWAAAVALVALMSLGDPLAGFRDQIGSRHREALGDRNLRLAFRWIADHTPNGSVAILPPWPRESFYLARRAQIANWAAVRLDQMTEWRARMEAMVGPLSDTDPRQVTDEAMEQRYARLTDAGIQTIRARYGGDYLVSRTPYAYAMLFDSGTYRVYALGSAAKH